MTSDSPALSPRELAALAMLALVGFLGPNGVFVYWLLFRTSELVTAMRHPVTLAFVVEAFLVMGLIAAFIARRPKRRFGWKTFVVLSLLGGLAFGIPAFVLLEGGRARDE